MPVQATASHDMEQARATSGLNGIDKSSPAPAGTPEAQRAACLRMPGWPTRNTFSNWPSGRTDVSRGQLSFSGNVRAKAGRKGRRAVVAGGQAMTFHEYLSKAVQHDAQQAGERDRLLLVARRARTVRPKRVRPAAPVRRLARLLFGRAPA
jgi:hypothetical protein